MNPMAMRWGKLYKGTPAELELENAVAALGVPYRTQFPYFLYGLRFFPDFLLPTLGVIIEVDDRSHRKADKILADQERTEALEAEGWRVIRCTNEEALSDPHGTVRALLSSIGMWPARSRRSVANGLPRPRSAPQKQRREAISGERRRRRGTGSTAPAAPPKRPTPDPAPLAS